MQEMWFCPISGGANMLLFAGLLHSPHLTQGLPALSSLLTLLQALLHPLTSLLHGPIWFLFPPLCSATPLIWVCSSSHCDISLSLLSRQLQSTPVSPNCNSHITSFILLSSVSCLPCFCLALHQQGQEEHFWFCFKIQSNPNLESQGKCAGRAQLSPCSPGGQCFLGSRRNPRIRVSQF